MIATMNNPNKLPLTEELDFHYLLELMPALHNISKFEWLPELFSIIGHESLIMLCKYAGGECIQIPTLEELSDSVTALQLFYDIEIKQCRDYATVPSHILPIVKEIKEIYDARNSETPDSNI